MNEKRGHTSSLVGLLGISLLAIVVLALVAPCVLGSGAVLPQRSAAYQLEEGGVRLMMPLCLQIDEEAEAGSSSSSGGGNSGGNSLLNDVVTGAVSGLAGALAAAAIATGDAVAKPGETKAMECISLEGIRGGTIEGLIQLHQDSGCRVILTRAISSAWLTPNSEFSYAKGYRVDVVSTSCLSGFITSHYTRRADPRRKDGAAVYENEDGDMFFEKAQSWEMVFF